MIGFKIGFIGEPNGERQRPTAMGTRHLTVVGLLASMLAAGLITGCAQGTGTPSAGGSSSVSSSPSSSASDGSPSSSPGPSSPPSSASPEPTGDVTLSGQVEAGVEANCLILRADGKTYQLVGGDKTIVKAGNNVVVRGHVVKGLMSYCMQGQPFQITEARLA
jgi:hypothetical protein